MMAERRMNSESRIPELNAVSFDGALQWFAEMQCRGLLFHPDDGVYEAAYPIMMNACGIRLDA